MCLMYAGLKETTKEDMVCYKVYVSFEGKLVSPYMRSPMPNMNEITKTRLGKPYGSGRCVDEGFHSFANLEDALKIGADIPQLYDIVIIKCIIPKDSKCYVGSFWGMTSYCSESIILKEIVIYETN